jgi:hypothetical protein
VICVALLVASHHKASEVFCCGNQFDDVSLVDNLSDGWYPAEAGLGQFGSGAEVKSYCATIFSKV